MLFAVNQVIGFEQNGTIKGFVLTTDIGGGIQAQTAFFYDDFVPQVNNSNPVRYLGPNKVSGSRRYTSKGEDWLNATTTSKFCTYAQDTDNKGLWAVGFAKVVQPSQASGDFTTWLNAQFPTNARSSHPNANCGKSTFKASSSCSATHEEGRYANDYSAYASDGFLETHGSIASGNVTYEAWSFPVGASVFPQSNTATLQSDWLAKGDGKWDWTQSKAPTDNLYIAKIYWQTSV